MDFLDETDLPKVNDRVSVPDGRVGRVIGYYKRDPETVVVSFDAGGSDEFKATEVHRAFVRYLDPPRYR